MHRLPQNLTIRLRSEPRRRGDAPRGTATFARRWFRTPQARGCTAAFIFTSYALTPNPAGAGMHRLLMVLAAHMRTEPRRRGDAPPWCDVLPECFGRTPQARGCTGFMKKEPVSNLPNPAGAGMHRGINSHHPNLYSEPRRRGDAPEFAGTQDFAGLRTPQARGCTGQTIFGLETKFPNPAGAGMHRAGVTPRYSAPSEPRRRGDAPKKNGIHSGP